ncbi:MAG: hypothetical protein M9962_07175 [Oligoflexia bacterium]|nr:hypothetical protein [Oligoflexia bacterium]
MKSIFFFILTLALFSCQSMKTKTTETVSVPDGKVFFEGEEKYFTNVRQLTFGGQNAEAYFSPEGDWLIFQSQRGDYPCDEMYAMRIDGSDLRKVSTGKGRVTCGYLYGLNEKAESPANLIYASTHDAGETCPAKPDYSRGYVWPIYSSYELYTNDFDKNNSLKRLTNNNAYDAEATISPNQLEMVYTSTQDGDLDLYTMDVDGKNRRRITKDLGYDGGAFFSHDGEKLVYRAYHPKTAKEKKDYIKNLKAGVYRPSWLEIFVINKDGTGKKQITNLKGGSFAPFFFPSDNKIIFSSNYQDPKGRKFNLYSVDTSGKNLEQITFSETFDAFAMFSPDGKKIVWASNRNGKVPGETNIFIADWVGSL